MSAEYKDLRRLQGLFLRQRKESKTEAVETQLKTNNVYNTIYQSGKSKEAGAWLEDRGLDHVGLGIPNRLPEPPLDTPSPAVSARDLCVR